MKAGFALLAALAGLYLVASPNGMVVSVGLLTFAAGMAVVCRELARTSRPGCGEDGRPVPPGPAVTYHPRTLHLVSAPADVNAVEPGVPAPSSLRRPGGAGTTNGGAA